MTWVYTRKNTCIDTFSNLSAFVPWTFQTSYWYSAWFTLHEEILVYASPN